MMNLTVLGAAALGLAAAVSIKLCLKSWKESAFAPALLACFAASSALALVLGSADGLGADAPQWAPFFGDTAFLAVALFVWWTFQRRSSFGRACAGFMVTAAGALLFLDWKGAGLEQEALRWMRYAIHCAALSWGAVEGTFHHRRLATRVRLGAVDPSVASRMRLWTMAMVVGAMALTANAFGSAAKLRSSDLGWSLLTASEIFTCFTLVALALIAFPVLTRGSLIEARDASSVA